MNNQPQSQVNNNQLRINRDARKLSDFLASVCSKHHKQYELGHTEATIANTLMLAFHVAPIISVVKGRINKLSKFEPKHGTIEYWSPMIINMMKGNFGAMRQDKPSMPWLKDWSQLDPFSFDHICNQYLLTDYGYDDLVRLMQILSLYNYDEIKYACGVGRSNNVYELRYILAVLEKERAKTHIVQEQKAQLQAKVDASDRLLNQTIHHHTPLDMAQVEYNWSKQMENSKLIADFDRIAREWGDKK